MESAFTELSLVITVAVGVSFFMRLIRQPLIIGYIITGLVVGPAFLNIVHSPETLQVFADFGVALLLFIVGLGLNPRIIKEVGKIAGFIAIFKVIVATAIGYGLAKLLGYSDTTAIYIGMALSFSSTIIILKLLSDKKEQSRLYGKISIGYLLIEDFIATLVMVGVSASGSGDFTANDVLPLFYKIILLIAALTTVRLFFLSRIQKLISSSQEFLFLFAIGWGIGIASLFKAAGFSLEIGALIAGVTLAPLPFAQEASARLKPLRDFFIVLFFVLLGSHLELNHAINVLPTALLFSLVVLIINPLVVMTIMGIGGYTKKTSFNAGLTGAQISEFSLILIFLANRMGQINDETVSLITIIGLLTIAISTYTITYSEKLYEFFGDSLRMFERRKIHYKAERQHHYELVLFGYLKGGHEFLRVFQQLDRPYIVVDYDPKVIDTLESLGANYVYGDVTDFELLDELDIEKAKLFVSTVTDLQVNKSIAMWLEKANPHAVFICSADTAEQAAELYSEGVSYVILPHYIGSEKIGAFIKKSGLKKSEFKKFREKHLAYLESHYELFDQNQTET